MSLDGWKEKLFQRYLAWICRPARIAGHLKTLLPEPGQPAPIERERIRVAALQVEFRLYKDPLEYADAIHRRIREAVKEGARLVVFPEYNSLPLLGLLPGIEKIEEAYRNKETSNSGGNKEEEISLTEVFRYMSPAVRPLVHTIFSNLSSAYGLYIMAGSYPLADNGDLINRSFLYGPTGELIGSQDKVHLLPIEAEWNLKRGSSFSVFETALGRLALPVCMDATYFETFRILVQKGAHIVLLPIADMQEYNYWLALRGIWPRLQESPIYGIKSALVGSIAGLTFTGRAGIFAPLELTPEGNGVLAEVEAYDREGIALADLDLKALDDLRSNHPWRDSNPA
ncbi:MAG: nitrilase-related carbon-nitrogen hydrolase, partial [Bacillota bacterium]